VTPQLKPPSQPRLHAEIVIEGTPPALRAAPQRPGPLSQNSGYKTPTRTSSTACFSDRRRMASHPGEQTCQRPAGPSVATSTMRMPDVRETARGRSGPARVILTPSPGHGPPRRASGPAGSPLSSVSGWGPTPANTSVRSAQAARALRGHGRQILLPQPPHIPRITLAGKADLRRYGRGRVPRVGRTAQIIYHGESRLHRRLPAARCASGSGPIEHALQPRTVDGPSGDVVKMNQAGLIRPPPSVAVPMAKARTLRPRPPLAVNGTSGGTSSGKIRNAWSRSSLRRPQRWQHASSAPL